MKLLLLVLEINVVSNEVTIVNNKCTLLLNLGPHVSGAWSLFFAPVEMPGLAFTSNLREPFK